MFEPRVRPSASGPLGPVGGLAATARVPATGHAGLRPARLGKLEPPDEVVARVRLLPEGGVPLADATHALACNAERAAAAEAAGGGGRCWGSHVYLQECFLVLAKNAALSIQPEKQP